MGPQNVKILGPWGPRILKFWGPGGPKMEGPYLHMTPVLHKRKMATARLRSDVQQYVRSFDGNVDALYPLALVSTF